MSHIIAALSILFVFGIFAATNAAEPSNSNCDGNTIEINNCLYARFQEKDKELNATYKKVMKVLSQPDVHGIVHYSEAKKELIKAQKAWIAVRDGDCNAVYALAIGGSIRGQLALECKQSRTEQRIRELEQLISE